MKPRKLRPDAKALPPTERPLIGLHSSTVQHITAQHSTAFTSTNQ
jgi:hypothetical protein